MGMGLDLYEVRVRDCETILGVLARLYDCFWRLLVNLEGECGVHHGRRCGLRLYVTLDDSSRVALIL